MVTYRSIAYIIIVSCRFSAVSVIGVDIGEFVCGRPYGGCAILYKTPLSFYHAFSLHFKPFLCTENSGSFWFFINIYMPSLSKYLDMLGVLLSHIGVMIMTLMLISVEAQLQLISWHVIQHLVVSLEIYMSRMMGLYVVG